MHSTTLALLQHGKLSLQGEFLWGSNYTFLVQVQQGEESLLAVYKPTRGVRPLWDFPPDTLAKREVAAYLVSEALGWHLIPPTAYRLDGPHGPGSLQQFIEHDPEYHYFHFTPERIQRLRPIALFDLVVNNADRKGSHIILDPEGRLWAIDHGICFHVEEKIRTVIWDFAGEPIPEPLLVDLKRLLRDLVRNSGWVTELERYLSSQEIAALAARTQRLIAEGHFSHPPQHRRYFPYPLV
jgi:hypothetical protein